MKPGARILVAHYSLSGNTERVAEDLATRLGAERQKIGELRKRRGLLGYLRAVLDSLRETSVELAGLEKDPNDFALTVIGTPIWAGKITPAVRAYLRLNRGRFREVAFFTTSGSTPVEKVVPAMERLAGCRAVALAGFDYVDLKNGSLYERKINAFVEALQRDHPSFACAREPEHVPA